MTSDFDDLMAIQAKAEEKAKRRRKKVTSDFDDLMAIHAYSKKYPGLKPLTEWLAGICVQEADTRKPGWTLEEWKKSQRGEIVLKLYGEEELKWSYLDECHDVLDHAQWHLRVFKPDTQLLIHYVYDLFRGRECWIQDLKKKVRRHLPKLLELLRAYGVEEDKYQIKIKGIPRAEF